MYVISHDLITMGLFFFVVETAFLGECFLMEMNPSSWEMFTHSGLISNLDAVFPIGKNPTRSAVSYKTPTYYREFFSPKRNGPEI